MRVRLGYTEWIQMHLIKHVGTLHTWAKGTEDPSPRADVLWNPNTRTLDGQNPHHHKH